MNITNGGMVRRCTACEGKSVMRSEQGGIAYGGCDRCDGTGLIYYG